MSHRLLRAAELREVLSGPENERALLDAREGGLCLGSPAMFVLKAAVVGAGVMGGEIAQVIAAADIPVLLKDVEPEFVDKGLEKAREVSQGQAAKLVKREKLTQEEADAQVEHTLGLISGTTEYDGFGDVDFVIEGCPRRWRSSIRSSPTSTP